MSASPTDLTALPRFVEQIEGVLGEMRTFGVRWSNTRFGEYLRLLQTTAGLEYPRPLPGADGSEERRILFEAISQCRQLQDGMEVLRGVDRSRARSRLTKIFRGRRLPPTAIDENDTPRNTLFEIATAAALSRAPAAFRLEFPGENDVDLRAFHPHLAEPFAIECKRPAHVGSLTENIKKVRSQVRDRRAAGEFGLAVFGLDRMQGSAGGAATAPSSSAFLAECDADIQRLTRRILVDQPSDKPLFPHVPVAAVLLLGVFFSSDRGQIYTTSRLQFFCTTPEGVIEPVCERIKAAFARGAMPSSALSPS